MTSPNGSSTLRELHVLCGCAMSGQPDRDGFTRLSKDHCNVSVENLTTAIDCDCCEAFTARENRPDIVAVRQCQQRDEWLVLEMKRRLREKAGLQARAALSKLGSDPKFPLVCADFQLWSLQGRRYFDVGCR